MALRLRTDMPELKGATEWINGEIDQESLDGKPVLIHFWSVSCGLCKASMPDVLKIRDDYREKGLQVIGIHMPRSEKDTNIDLVKETIEKHEMTHPQAVDNKHAIVDAFENEFVPAFFLYDEEGKLRHRSAGEKALSMMKKPLERVLGTID
ncbi:Thiol-disulfide isomerase or thioredoxin [Marininema mesophilum]|uniref:Thiol-disulfide isomerase or thioredoxin n=1 Tax=Marininema mesophilum TaxID=1048340 RepID=A0A1H2Z1L8_9BACL|nr:redoxin domain-containing protein [Marininema mesophilum]SDX11231.1 Thiol-disulfide isomerase or thioredoxin [Marininema mesophilum]